MVQMVDSWIKALYAGQMAGICLLDISSAFDIVNQDILLEKMALYGCQEDVIQWFKSF